MPAHEVLTERASRSGKLVCAISSGGLSTRPSSKAYEELKSPYDEPRKPSASPLSPMREDAEVLHTCLRLDYFYCHITPNKLSEAHLKRLVSGPQLTLHLTRALPACMMDAVLNRPVTTQVSKCER